MRTGSKKIFHLEAWVIKVMSLQKVRVLFTSRIVTYLFRRSSLTLAYTVAHVLRD